jgi:hypothetical protein
MHVLATIDWGDLITGLTSQFEGAVTDVLPLAAVVIGATLVFKTYKRFISKAS